jgi:hypothetical protein
VMFKNYACYFIEFCNNKRMQSGTQNRHAS